MAKKSAIAYVPATTSKAGYQQATATQNLNISIYSLNSQQIGGQAGAIDSTVTLYTVPSDYTFFVTSVNMEIIKYTAVAGVNGRGKILLNGQTVMRLYSPFTESDFCAQNLTFAQPFILHSSETIQVVSESANGLAQAGFVGFLVRNADLIQK